MTNTSELLSKHSASIKYIESRGVSVDLNEVIELGIEVLSERARRQEPPESMGKKTLFQVINAGCRVCPTWTELVKYVSEAGYDISNVKNFNDNKINGYGLKSETVYLERQTRGEYTISANGTIRAN